MNELISVIIPVYKVEEYLKRCVDSVLTQTYGNTEIILVDDGSPDGCPAICDAFAEADSRVRVIHQENKGLILLLWIRTITFIRNFWKSCMPPVRKRGAI